MVKQSG